MKYFLATSPRIVMNRDREMDLVFLATILVFLNHRLHTLGKKVEGLDQKCFGTATEVLTKER